MIGALQRETRELAGFVDRHPGREGRNRVQRVPARADALQERTRPIDARVRQDERELLAAVASDAVDLPRSISQRVREPAQRLVAGLMAEAVVHALEVIEIDDDERVTGLQRLQRAGEGAAVRKIRQRIGLRVVFERSRLPQPTEHPPRFIGEQLSGLACRSVETRAGRAPHCNDQTHGRAARVRHRDDRGRSHRALTAFGDDEARGVVAVRVDEQRRSIGERGMAEVRAVQIAPAVGAIGEQDRYGLRAKELGRERREQLRTGALVVDSRQDAHRVQQAFHPMLGASPAEVGASNGVADDNRQHDDTRQLPDRRAAIEDARRACETDCGHGREHECGADALRQSHRDECDRQGREERQRNRARERGHQEHQPSNGDQPSRTKHCASSLPERLPRLSIGRKGTGVDVKAL